MSQHGGKRTGAGRKPQSGKFKEPTKPIRIPVSLLSSVESALAEHAKRQRAQHPSEIGKIQPFVHRRSAELPLFASRVAAGFPTPAEDYIETALDLNEHLIHHPAATFFVRANGQSMIGVGIQSGDILIVDRALSPRHNSIIIAVLNGELTVKRLSLSDSLVRLVSENPDFPPIPVHENSDFQVWGVVTAFIHQFQT